MNDLNLESIVEEEKMLVLNAEEKYGDFFIIALEIGNFLQSFFDTAKYESFLFLEFLGYIRTHYFLTLLSVVRLHHVQAMMDLRQIIEAGANAAYALANSEIKDFAVPDKKEGLKFLQTLDNKRIKWLKDNYSEVSEEVKKIKNDLNASCLHSNIAYAHKNSKFLIGQDKLVVSFFDNDGDYAIKHNLWFIGFIVLKLLDLFYGINKDYKALNFSNEFVSNFKKLHIKNNQLRKNLINSIDTFKKVSRTI